MQIVGKKVVHKTLGPGEVIEQTEDRIIVRCSFKEIKLEYPDSFNGFLKAEDPELQAALLDEISQKEERKVKLRAEEELRKKEEAEREAEERRMMDEQARSALGKRPPLPEKKRVMQKRIPGRRLTFFVFQGGTFDQEYDGGYIWAPTYNKAGHRCHYWDRLQDVRPGDVIFHGCDGSIRAISTAHKACPYPQPEEIRFSETWDNEGLRVDCDYILIDKPVKTALLRNDILRLCSGIKYAPFDRDGNGNLGYLYELNRELACIFLKEIIKENPLIGDLDYVREILAEENK